MQRQAWIFIILFSLTACGNKYPQLDTLPEIKASWYDLGIRIPFFEKEKGRYHDITIYPTKTAIAGDDYKINLKPMGDSLAAVVFDPKTENPFKVIFSDIYQKKYRKKYKDCDFTGFKFELDGNTATDEWYLSFPADYCLYDEDSFFVSDYGSHGWIVQRQTSGSYRVLMEGYGLLYISKKQTRQGYQSIRQRVFTEYSTRTLSHAALNSPQRRGMKDPPCGAGWIHWEYKENQYQPVTLAPIRNSCSDEYEHHIEDKELFIARTQKTIKRRLLTWVSKVTGKPMEIDHNNRLFSVEEPK